MAGYGLGVQLRNQRALLRRYFRLSARHDNFRHGQKLIQAIHGFARVGAPSESLGVQRWRRAGRDHGTSSKNAARHNARADRGLDMIAYHTAHEHAPR